jgi:predicted nucleic acid-binding protein
MRILVDTNMLLRAVEPAHTQHHRSVEAIDALQRRGHDLVIVPQVLYEFWSVATRPIENNGLGMSPSDAQAELAAIQRFFRMLRDERAIFAIWELLVSSLGIKGKQVHDARLAAAMRRHAITHLLTFNGADFTRYSFATALNPDDVVSGVVSI